MIILKTLNFVNLNLVLLINQIKGKIHICIVPNSANTEIIYEFMKA